MVKLDQTTIGLGLVIPFVAIVAFFVFSFYQQQAKFNSTLPSTTSSAQTPVSNPVILSPTTVQKHASPNDCWVIINNKVYDVTGYLNLHPGGANVLSAYCGQDATSAFLTQGGNGSHSTTAFNLLNNLYIGDLNQPQEFQINPKNIQNNPQFSQGDDNEGGEDD